MLTLAALAKNGWWCGERREFLENAVGQPEGCGGHVLFKVSDRRCAGNRQHNLGAREEPCESELKRLRAQFFCPPVEEVVSLPILSERRPGDESDTVLLAEVERGIPLAVGEAVAVLH